MQILTVEQAEKNLVALLERARAGEEIVISDGRQPSLRLEPVNPPSRRGLGALQGKIKVADEDLFGPLPEAIAKA